MIKDKSIFIKNIYYMLSYAFSTLRQGEYENIATEEFDNIHNLFAAILAKGIGRQLKQGLHREYRNYTEELSSVRGKIDIRGTVNNYMARKRLLTCEFDDLSENNLLNQILKSTVMLLLHHGKVKSKYKNDLRKEMLFFSDVDIIDLSFVRWSVLQFQRNNQSYRMLMGICQLIIEGMLQTNEKGEHKLSTFIDEQQMSRLYEKFLLEFYCQECPEVKAESAQIDWMISDGKKQGLPVMQSDIMLSKGNTVLIIDAKYYTNTMQVYFDSYTVHSKNLYQIFTYVKNKEAEFHDSPHTVSGMLLYARTDEEKQPDYKYMMGNNRIDVMTLDLNREFSDIKSYLKGIVGEFFKAIA